MPLFDTVKRINTNLELADKAKREAADSDAIAIRRAALFKQHGARWFGELGLEMEELSTRFNQHTKDESKHLRISRQQPGAIEIIFISPKTRSLVDPFCTVKPIEADLSVICEFILSSGPEQVKYKILPTEENKIEVLVSASSQSTQGYFSAAERSAQTSHMNVSQFADFVLDTFVNYKW